MQATADSTNILASQATIAALTTYAIQWVKRSPYFPWLTTETQSINRWISGLVAVCSGLGIFLTWDHSAGILTITGLTLTNLLHAGSKVVEQWVIQHAAYKTLVAPPLPGPVRYQQDRDQSPMPMPAPIPGQEAAHDPSK